MMVVIEASVIYLAAVVKVNNITCRVLLDADAAIFYASSGHLNIQSVMEAMKQVEMMMDSIVRKTDVIEVILVEGSSSRDQ